MLGARKWIFVALNKKENEILNISCCMTRQFVIVMSAITIRENLRQTKRKYFQTENSFPVFFFKNLS